MNLFENHVAFGAPGIEPRWTSSAKEGVGTAYHTSCRLWLTLSHGIINEIYYPRVDQPNTRDFQFLITNDETFCHEEKRESIRWHLQLDPSSWVNLFCKKAGSRTNQVPHFFVELPVVGFELLQKLGVLKR